MMKLLMERWRKYIDEECEEDEVEQLATFAHQGQTRRGGEPYITHPRAAADYAKEFGYPDAIADAALLHDTLEDYHDPEEMAELIKSVCPEALPIVKELTHDKDIEYTDYVLSLSPDAVAVKLLDMYHNSQDLKPDSKQYNKYHNALVALGGKPNGINDAHWEALTSQLGVESEINERDWQKESERVTNHERNKDELLGDGGQENKAPYEDEPIKPRSKSAPPAG